MSPHLPPDLSIQEKLKSLEETGKRREQSFGERAIRLVSYITLILLFALLPAFLDFLTNKPPAP